MVDNPNASCIYNIKSPQGQEFLGIVSLKDFCKEHGLVYRRAAQAAREGRPYRNGWIITRVEKAKTEYDKLKEYGLSTEERLNRALEENTKLRTVLKAEEQEESLYKMLAGVIRESTPVIDVKPYKFVSKKTKITESAILMLSDLHADQEILFSKTRGLENYSFDVACRRAERVVDTTISHLIDNLKNYSYETLYIFGLGDFINGTIHDALQFSKYKNSIKNALATGELLAQMIKDLSVYFPKIVFIGLSGNHGRFSPKIDWKAAQQNWDYLVNSHAVSRLQSLVDAGRLEYLIPDAWSTMVKIYNFNFLLSHGSDIKAFNGIPYYGIERKSRRLLAIGAATNQIPHYIMMGHFHSLASQAQPAGEVFINGSFIATDEFALESMGACNEPVQYLLGVHESYGVTLRMPIHLREPNWRTEELKTGRYKITVP